MVNEATSKFGSLSAGIALALAPFVFGSMGCRLLVGDERQYDGSGGATSATASSDASTTGSGDCGDTQSSDQNCGVCGHVCTEGPCIAGDCVVQITSAQPQAEFSKIVVDESSTGYVYFARYRPGKIYRAKKEALALTEPLADAPGGSDGWTWDLESNTDSLYFSNYTARGDKLPERGYYAMDKDGSNLRRLGGETLFGAAQITPLDDQILVSTAYDPVGIGTMPLTGGPVKPWVKYAAPSPVYQLGGKPFLFASPYVYFTESSAGISRLYEGTTVKTPIYPNEKDGLVIATGPGLRLYWVVESQDKKVGSLKRGSVDGAAPVETLANVGYVRGWFVHGSYLYFSDDQKIRRVVIDQEPPTVETVLETDDTVGSLAADATSFYWMAFSDGRVFRKSF